jgi:hypothetical protein
MIVFIFIRNNSIIKCPIHLCFFSLSVRATFSLINTDDPSPKLIRISECLLYFNFKNQKCAYNIAH